MGSGLQWDVFCRVIDNHGDLGVCWRLARELASAGHAVRLWADDASALAWMAPDGEPGVSVLDWSEPSPEAVGDVVVEAFGCDPPAAFVQAMAQRVPAPVWINLEYLSAEAWVERSHGLPSPTPCGLTKWFFFPGFTPATGGLMQGGLQPVSPVGFDGRTWLAARGWAVRPGERVISLFCYEQPWLAEALAGWADRPTLLLATPGHATRQLRALTLPSEMRVIELPWLAQPDYDRLLWSCDLNAVRGEDSFVRALWADAPLLWQLYPQHDGVHALKLQAFLDRYLQGLPAPAGAAVAQWMRHWNGLLATGEPAPPMPDLPAWRSGHAAFRSALWAQDDLATRLCRFVAGKREPGDPDKPAC